MVTSVKGAGLTSVNPATEATIESFDVLDAGGVDRLLGRADSTFRSWRSTDIGERAAMLRRAGQQLRAERERYAATITREMGKTITEALAEVDKCAAACDHYADHGPAYIADEAAPSTSSRSFVACQPLGPVLAVMPWNFPLWQVFRFAAPALLAGNVGVLKHAANVTRCALDIEEVFRIAGLPEGGFSTLLVRSDAMDAVIEDPRIVAVTLTGSDATGAKVAARAGANLKKTVLELGGSDAFLVLEDADLEAAATVGAKSRFQNAGQSCIAAKRFIVVESVAEQFEELLIERARALRVGDPTSTDSQMGPLAREDLRAGLERQLQESVAQGARVATGGRRPQEQGWFLDPTVLVGCDAETTAFREETFGPLAAVTRVADAEAGLALANASQYGLGGNIWTRDAERGIALARRMETGGVFVNGMTHSDPRLPFGGVKRSGYGRELWREGIREFVNIQAIWVAEEPEDEGGAAVE